MMGNRTTIKRTIQMGNGSYLCNVWADGNNWSGTRPAEANALLQCLEYKGMFYSVLFNCNRDSDGNEKTFWTCKPASERLSKQIRKAQDRNKI